MRKSVLFFISIMFIISIVVVSFFGMQARVDQFKSYITDVNITSYDTIVGNTKYLFVDYLGPIDTFVPIRYSVLPNKAEQLNNVEYLLYNNTYVEDGETKEFASINKNNGILEFYNYLENNCTVTVTVRSIDGSNKSDSVIVILRQNN